MRQIGGLFFLKEFLPLLLRKHSNRYKTGDTSLAVTKEQSAETSTESKF
jgi:hypothetical protein